MLIYYRKNSKLPKWINKLKHRRPEKKIEARMKGPNMTRGGE
jgi:putative component of toxin-antitoxin plasmid stabilization module